MNKFKLKNKYLLFILLAVVGVLAVVHIFMFRHTVALATKSQTLQADIVELTEKNNQIQSLQNNISEILDDYNKLQKLFIEKEGVIDLIQFIETISTKAGVTLKVDKVTKQEFRPIYPTKEIVLIDVISTGTKSDMLQFLETIEHLPYKVSIKNVALQQLDKETRLVWELRTTLSFIKIK